jgi:hypothetical protein
MLDNKDNNFSLSVRIPKSSLIIVLLRMIVEKARDILHTYRVVNKKKYHTIRDRNRFLSF